MLRVPLAVSVAMTARRSPEPGEYYDPYTGRSLGASDVTWSSLIMEILEPDARAPHGFVGI